MPTRTLTQLASRLRRETIPIGSTAETDRDLLTRFLQEQDESAFEALVRRHDRLVRSAVAKVLSDPHDAEDAFQATFLVLVRRAEAIDWRGGPGAGGFRGGPPGAGEGPDARPHRGPQGDGGQPGGPATAPPP